METQQLIERVKGYERTKNVWRNRHDSTEFREASQLNQILFGMPLNRSVNCGCVEDLFFYIKNSNKVKQINEQTMTQFSIKKDKNGNSKLIQFAGSPDILSNKNLTDEKAFALLKKSPGHIVCFDKFPADWREQIGLDADPEPVVELTPREKRESDLKSLSLSELVVICEQKEFPKSKFEKVKKESTLIKMIIDSEFEK